MKIFFEKKHKKLIFLIFFGVSKFNIIFKKKNIPHNFQLLLAIHAHIMHPLATCSLHPFYFLFSSIFQTTRKVNNLEGTLDLNVKIFTWYLYSYIFWKDFAVIHLFCFFLQSFTLSEALLLIRQWRCEVAKRLPVFIWQFHINTSR